MNKSKFDQEYHLMQLIITSEPKDYGMRINYWTVKNIQRLILLKWGIEIKKSCAYAIIGRLKKESSLFRAKLKSPLDLDLDSWDNFYYYNKEEKARKKLWAVKYYFYQGKNKAEILKLLNCSSSSFDNWLSCFSSGGLNKLLSKTKWTNLEPKDKKELVKILENKKPIDYGIKDKSEWDSITVKDVASLTLGVELAVSQVCEILKEAEAAISYSMI